MTSHSSKSVPAVAVASTVAGAALAAQSASVEELITKIKSTDDAVRGPAWQGAGPAGAPAVRPLSEVMTDPDFEIARSAKRALWKIVRHAGRPGAQAEAKAVTAQLIPLLASGPTPVRREVLWMLSEIAGDEAVAPMAALLTHKELREDARCALQRVPGDTALTALKDALAAAPADFKASIAVSLRVRGVPTPGIPDHKLVPTKQTSVTPGGP